MNKDQFFALLRELLMAVGAAVMTWGKMSNGTWETISGLVLAAVSLGWALHANEGHEMVLTLARKLISAAAGAVVATGLIAPEKADALVGVLGSVVSVVWAMMSKGGLPPNVSGGVKLLLLMMSLLLASCGLSVTEDGCVLGSYAKGEQTWKAGVCVGTDGKVNRVRVQWENGDGQELRATVYAKAKKTELEYRSGEIWVKWGAKSGVTLGPLPPGVEVKGEGPVEVKPAEAVPDGDLAPKIVEELPPVIVAAK